MSKKKNNRPYNNVNNRSNRNISKNNKPVKRNKNVNNDKNKELENTTRIRIDEGRINDLDTLDTSFLEGRLDKKSKDKYVKEKLLIEKKKLFFDLTLIKKIFMLIACLGVVILAILVFINNKDDVKVKNENKEKVVSSEEKEEVIDDNYLFVGDFYTDEFDFEELDYHYVKVAEEDLTTTDLLDDLKKKIYQYNPSIVFIQLGINDLNEEKSVTEIIDNLEEIVEQIKENRPYTKICLESLYPINKEHSSYDDEEIHDDIDNEKIKEVNKKIKILSKEYDIEYLDVFSLLSEEDKLNDDYTEDGLKINSLGYEKILKEINKIVG